MSVSTAIGARPLAKKKSANTRNPDEWSEKPTAVIIRGSAQWKEWVERLAKANRQTVSGLVDTALARIAKEIAFEDPPER